MKNLPESIILFILFIVFTAQYCKTNEIVLDDYKPDPVLAWSEKMMMLAIEKDGLLTLNGVRTQALANIAIHNALNAIQPAYTSYEYPENYPRANPLAAVSQAAYEVAIDRFPEKASELEKLLNDYLSDIKESESKQSGIRLGKETAAKILEIRKNDGWDGEAGYSWHPMAPGVYAEFSDHSGTPEGFIFGSGWAAAEPFMLTGQDQFRSPPPPPINSEAYTRAFNEVKQYRSTNSAVRSNDQSHMAMWWKDFVEHSHNRLARELIKKENLNLWEAARTLALLNMTVYDAYVNVFDNKFYYNHWRPYTAIRWAANDENSDTEADESWNNLHQHTYPFPSYPSAHGTASSAAMRILSSTLGTGDHYPFTMTTKQVDRAGPFSEKVTMNPATRSFRSFSEAGMEAGLSRVYLGIHFRYDSEEGHRLGNEIGDYANDNFLTLIKTNE